ncbi:MAG: aminoglycoside phosphotransferase family protein [Chloroflexi bacterium]|nr:aminoglycoside phosphotransferase family protein [Chloroflexota bacterium]
MHIDEVDVDVFMVGRLLAAQFPQWADLPLTPLVSAGTDNAIYRLGDDMAVRLPLIPDAASRLQNEYRWLPELAPRLPLVVPIPLALGKPDEGYPFTWAVYSWIEGENATIERLTDPSQAARELARFITALQRIDPTGGPSPGVHNSWRGVPLATRDRQTRAAIASLNGRINTEAATAAWEAALQVPAWPGPPVWIHGDLQSGNLLAVGGRLTAVIDFGCLGVGDPACDLAVAWNLFSAETRGLFHKAIQVDEATWTRGRGWALSIGLIALPYYKVTNPALTAIAQHAIEQVLNVQE